MSATRRGWCPTALDPMESGDGLLVRIKPPGGQMTAAQAREVAALAARLGNGAIELTRRGNLQIRGLRAAGAAEFAEAAVALGLACADPAAERRRSVTACALEPGAETVTLAIEAALVEATHLAALPAKFAVTVDGDGFLPLRGLRADIAVQVHGHDGDARAAAAVACGADRFACAPSDLPALVCDLAGAILVRCGSDAGRRDPRRPVSAPPFFPHPPVGPIAADCIGIGMAFGQTDAAGLAALADLSDAETDGLLRLTPFRAVVLRGLRPSRAARDTAERLGWIVTPDDPRLRASACPGAPFCAAATVPARADAARLIAELEAAANPAASAAPRTLHVSGCAKGCAHPAPAAVTLVGRDGLYDLVREGRANAAPVGRGLTLTQATNLLRGTP